LHEQRTAARDSAIGILQTCAVILVQSGAWHKLWRFGVQEVFFWSDFERELRLSGRDPHLWIPGEAPTS
jgi:hypothetical protein